MSILRVDQIQHSNGTAALTIDSSGRVLSPNRVAFGARSVSNITGAATPRELIFTNEDFDIGGGYNNTNGRFTAPVTGVYHITYNVFTTGVAQRRLSTLRLNGNNYTEITHESADDSLNSLSCSVSMRLNINDFVSVYTTANIINTSTLYCYFTGHLVG